MSEATSLKDAQRYDALRDLRKASHTQIVVALESMGGDARDILAWRLRDLAVDLGTVRQDDSAVALCEFVAETLR